MASDVAIFDNTLTLSTFANGTTPAPLGGDLSVLGIRIGTATGGPALDTSGGAAASSTDESGPPPVNFDLGPAIDAPGSDERCEAEFYIGEWQLLLDDRTAAIESLRAAANTCPRSFIEFTSARAELRLLGG